MIAALRSLLFMLVFYPTSAVIALLLLLGVFSKRWVVTGAHLCARWLLGICIAVRGTVPQGRVIVAMKHQSMFETLLTLYLFDHPAVVMKRELRNIPMWGYVAAQHGSIFVERDKGGVALRSLIRDARARAAEGRPILIFPEGTRVPVGEAPPLKAGLNGVYSMLDVPVVPVAHNAGLLWTKGLVKHAGTVTLAFRPAVPPGLPRERLEAAVHAAINEDPTKGEVA